MIYVLLSVACSVTVSILLKIARRYEVNIRQAIAFNYLMAAALCYLFYRPELSTISEAPVGIFLALGILIPLIFAVMAASVNYSGIVRTDIAQRLSLLIPLLAAYSIFEENYSSTKTLGILLGLIAMFCCIPLKKQESAGNRSWQYPLFVFLGFGLIDVLFKKLALVKTIPFSTSLFAIFNLALGISMAAIAYEKNRLIAKNILFGLILGVFNFGNILFYLKAHQALSTTPSVVFSSMNMGVIALGSLVGLWVFNEKLSKLNYFGIVLAFISIALIAFL